MPVAFISHRRAAHQMGAGHPEQPARLDAIEELLHVRQIHDFLVHHEAPRATVEQLARVHPRTHIERLGALSPEEGLARLDPDTAMCPDTFEAALRAAGANVLATDLVATGGVTRVLQRAPARPSRGVAQAMDLFLQQRRGRAAHAWKPTDLERVAIPDFDAPRQRHGGHLPGRPARAHLLELPVSSSPESNPGSVPGTRQLPAPAGQWQRRVSRGDHAAPAGAEHFAPQMLSSRPVSTRMPDELCGATSTATMRGQGKLPVRRDAASSPRGAAELSSWQRALCTSTVMTD
jgi:hypothetical protein